MNIRMLYTMVAVLSMAGATAVVPAFAQEPARSSYMGDDDMSILAGSIPVTVRTDASVYDHNSVIMVEGTVANIKEGYPVTVTVTSPTNNIVAIDQVQVGADGTYKTMFNTAADLWKYDGVYKVRVQYGSQGVNNKALIELTGGIPTGIIPAQPPRDCTGNELDIDGYCIPYRITGGSVTGAQINPGMSIIVDIESAEPGMITLSPAPGIFRNLELALVDDEQWDDVDVDGNSITVQFPAGTEKIEIFGRFVIPEFGAIAALVLAGAIAAIIAASARWSRLGSAMTMMTPRGQ